MRAWPRTRDHVTENDVSVRPATGHAVERVRDTEDVLARRGSWRAAGAAGEDERAVDIEKHEFTLGHQPRATIRTGQEASGYETVRM